MKMETNNWYQQQKKTKTTNAAPTRPCVSLYKKHVTNTVIWRHDGNTFPGTFLSVPNFLPYSSSPECFTKARSPR